MRLTFKKVIADAKTTHDLIVRDIDGLGGVIRENREMADRRYHNLTMAVLVAAPIEKETEVTKLLKEG